MKNKLNILIAIVILFIADITSIIDALASLNLFGLYQSSIHVWINILLIILFTITICSIVFKWEKYLSYSWFFVILAVIYPWYFYTFNGFQEESITKFLLEYIAVIFSGLSIIAVIYTLYLQRQQLTDQKQQLEHSNVIASCMYDAEVLKLINEFLSKDMAVCDLCNNLRDKMVYDKDKTIKDLQFAFLRQIKDDYNSNAEWRKFKDTEAYKEYAAFTRLARYFDMISHYKLSENTAQALHFYYIWWRSFIIDVRNVFIETYDNTKKEDRQLSFMPNWIHMTNSLDAEFLKNDCPLE